MTDKKKLLILNGSHAEIPLIKAAQKLGFYVITSGNNPHGLGHRYADEYHPADFSDKEAILLIAKEMQIDAICPCCNDFSIITSAYVAKKMGLQGLYDSYDTTLKLHHKDTFREFMQQNKLASPQAIDCDDVKATLENIKDWRYPLMVKPTDLSGGKGITKIDRYEQAGKAIEEAIALANTKKAVVEEFIEGSQHGFSTFLKDKKVRFSFADDEYYYKNLFLVSSASAPASVAENVTAALCKQSEEIASLLGLVDGILHIQYVVRDQQPVIIEITRRPPGDLYIEFVKHSTGVDYPTFLVKAYTGLDISDMPNLKVGGFYARHCIMADKKGVIKDIAYASSVKGNIIDKMLWGKEGDEIEDMMTHKCGIVFLKFDTMQEMCEKMPKMQELIKVEME